MNTVLVRHTSIVVPKGLCYGRIDVPLSESFGDEAEITRGRMPWIPDVIVSSPAARCRALAHALTVGGVPVLIDERLAELSMGRWEGRLWDELRGPEVDAWMADPWHERPPEGETADELIARVGTVRSELMHAAVERCAVITHAGVIRAWRSLAESRSLADLMNEAIPFGSVWAAR